MMATAFEILLDFPESKTAYFVDTVNKRLQSSRLRTGTRTRTTKKGVIKHPGLILPAVWAGQFYDLRNSIVHGDSVSLRHLRYRNRNQDSNHKWLTHLIVADLVFYELVIRLLFDDGLIGKSARKLGKDFGVPPETFFGMFYGFDNAYQAVGWLKKGCKA
jgi:hypothetical protein